MSRSVDLKISELKDSPFNVRKTYVQDEEFEANIKSLGVLEPLIVRKVDEGYEVIVGQCRFEAAKKAGIERIRCSVCGLHDMSDREAMLASLSENIARHDLTPLDKAIAVAQLLGSHELLKDNATPRAGHGETTYTERELARCLGVNDTTVDRWLKPLRLQPETRELVEKKAVPMKVAAKIRKKAKTPRDEVEVAQEFAKVDVGLKPGEKGVLPEREAVALLNKDLPKEKIIETLKAKRDPPHPPKEEKEADEWVPIESVTIDRFVVTDASIIALFNKHKIRPADHAQDILKAWLEKKGYS